MTLLEMVESIAPQRQMMSYDDYLDYAGESQIVEWVEGEVITYMPPVYKHQDLNRFLSTLLDLFVQFFDLGIVQYAPFEVKLWPNGPAREPNVFFVAKQHLSRLTPDRFEGGPDLIIEIISPSSVSEDRVHKFTQYQQAGVREYWLIDPRPRQQQADFYLLGQDNAYHPVPIEADGRYRATVLPEFWLNIDWLRQEPLPNPQLAFAEIMVSLESLPPTIRTTYQTLLDYLSG